GITDCLSKTMILEHIRNTQSLNKDCLIFADRPGCKFVQMVSACVCYFCVNPGNYQSCLASIVAAFYFTAQTTLANLQTSLFDLQKLWIWQLLAIREGRQIFQTNVNDNGR